VRILANENVPGPVVRALREQGHDVAWVNEGSRGAADDAVLAQARIEGRLLLTFDKDFGEMTYRQGLPPASGIILCRLSGPSPEEDNARAVAALTSRDDWAGHFAVIEDDRIRLRPLPAPKETG
jgi:predicted nuclease of predicted toxin-antitoxin system